MTSEQETKPELKDDIGEFRAVCRVARSLIDSGKLAIRIVYPNRVDLRVASDDLKAAAEAEGVSVIGCRGILDHEIAPLMAAELSGDPAILLMVASFAAGYRGGSAEDLKVTHKEVTERKSIVNSELITERLRERYLLKETSKTNPLTGWHWEISAKQFDDRKGSLPNIRHATVRIHARRRTGRYEEMGSEIIPPSLIEAQSAEAFAFDCDLEEAKELRETFDRIAEELQTHEVPPASEELTRKCEGKADNDAGR
jgi:hypothetical protein